MYLTPVTTTMGTNSVGAILLIWPQVDRYLTWGEAVDLSKPFRFAALPIA